MGYAVCTEQGIFFTRVIGGTYELIWLGTTAVRKIKDIRQGMLHMQCYMIQ